MCPYFWALPGISESCLTCPPVLLPQPGGVPRDRPAAARLLPGPQGLRRTRQGQGIKKSSLSFQAFHHKMENCFDNWSCSAYTPPSASDLPECPLRCPVLTSMQLCSSPPQSPSPS